METETIYISLENEGTDCWRPVQGKKIEPLVYQIESQNEKPEIEEWEFASGSIVRCVMKDLSGGERLVAVEKWDGNK